MNNVNYIEIEVMGTKEIHAIIDHGNGEFTSMLKSTYDEIITKQEASDSE